MKIVKIMTGFLRGRGLLDAVYFTLLNAHIKGKAYVFIPLLFTASWADAFDSVEYSILDFRELPAGEVKSIIKGVSIPEEIDTRANAMIGEKIIGVNTFFPKYRVAKYDLNGDGNDEIFLAMEGKGVCGQLCPYNIYKKVDGGIFISILGEDGYGIRSVPKGLVSSEVTNDFFDLIVVGKRGNGLWRFNGKVYLFDGKYME